MKKHRTKLLGSSSYTSKHDIIVNMFRRARNRAKKRKIEFNIELKDIKIGRRCPLLKTEFVAKDPKKAPSLDRIDNSKGYIKGNIAVISVLANTIKGNATDKELLTFSKNIKKYVQRKSI